MDDVKVNIVECMRDAIQGMHSFIPTDRKISYVNQLVASNLFEYIDFGSFVSPKAVPQMQDSEKVLESIEKINDTKLLAIIANEKGADIASKYSNLDYVGYPFSISETFQQRNTNASIDISYDRVKNILDILGRTSILPVIYISMAFGNPYGDTWNEEIVMHWVHKLQQLGIQRFSLADTTGEAKPNQIRHLFKSVKEEFSTIDWSIHLHSHPQNAMHKIEGAIRAGCTRFEGAILGFGGCPFAKDDLVGNISTELLLDRFQKAHIIDINKLKINFYELIT